MTLLFLRIFARTFVYWLFANVLV